MNFYTNKSNSLIDAAIYNANWIIANPDFQNKVNSSELLKTNHFEFNDSDSIEIKLFGPLPFTKKYDLVFYWDNTTLFLNKNKLNIPSEKIAILLINEYVNAVKKNKTAYISIEQVVDDLIYENKIMFF